MGARAELSSGVRVRVPLSVCTMCLCTCVSVRAHVVCVPVCTRVHPGARPPPGRCGEHGGGRGHFLGGPPSAQKGFSGGQRGAQASDGLKGVLAAGHGGTGRAAGQREASGPELPPREGTEGQAHLAVTSCCRADASPGGSSERPRPLARGPCILIWGVGPRLPLQPGFPRADISHRVWSAGPAGRTQGGQVGGLGGSCCKTEAWRTEDTPRGSRPGQAAASLLSRGSPWRPAWPRCLDSPGQLCRVLPGVTVSSCAAPTLRGCPHPRPAQLRVL